jgi:hypothetical protein
MALGSSFQAVAGPRFEARGAERGAFFPFIAHREHGVRGSGLWAFLGEAWMVDAGTRVFGGLFESVYGSALAKRCAGFDFYWSWVDLHAFGWSFCRVAVGWSAMVSRTF